MIQPDLDTAERATGAGLARRWQVLATLVVVYVFNHVDRSIITILQDPIKHEFGMSDTQVGLMSGFFFALLYALSSVPIARLADRGWSTEVIGASFAAFSLMTLGSGLAPSVAVLLLLRIGVGIGEGGGVPPATAVLAGLFPLAERGWAMGIYALGPPLGVMFGIVLGGWLGDHLGWRVAFVAVGLAGLMLSPLVYLIVRGATRPRVEARLVRQPSTTSLRADLKVLLRLRAFRFIVLAGAAQNCANLSMMAWTPSFYMRVHQMSGSQVGLYLGLVLGLGGVAGVLTGGWVSDRLGRGDQRWIVWLPAVASLLVMPAAFAQYLVPSASLSLLLAIVPGFLIYVVIGPYYASIHSLAPPHCRATAFAVQGMIVVIIALGVGPALAGAASDALTHAGVRNALRLVLPAMSLLNVVAIAAYLMAGRTYVAEQHG